MTLSPEILSGLQDVNYTQPTELQETVLPDVLEGKDALVKATDDRDKQAAFVVPALELINRQEQREGTQALILTPNPKESKAVDELVRAMGYHAGIKCASIDLDGEAEEQKEALQSGVEVIVGNPGSLHELMQEMRFIFRHVRYVVIDRADEMISLNLTDKIQAILKRVLSDHQTVIFTGEGNDDIKNLAETYLHEPAVIGFEDRSMSQPPKVSGNLSQGYIYVPNRMKISTLMAHVEDTPTDTCVIFTASKRGTDRLYRIFRKRNLKATSLHGKLSDEKRAQRFANFTNGDVQYLLVSDIPAAELNIDRVTQVINYDVPNDPDEYRYRAHMVGSGKASRIVSLVSKQDRSDINELENELGQAPKELPLPSKVKQKLNQRKKQKKKSKKQRGKKSRNGRGKQRKKKKDDMELPRPSFDKLSGGRSGKEDKEDQKSGVIGLIKKLFS